MLAWSKDRPHDLFKMANPIACDRLEYAPLLVLLKPEGRDWTIERRQLLRPLAQSQNQYYQCLGPELIQGAFFNQHTGVLALLHLRHEDAERGYPVVELFGLSSVPLVMRSGGYGGPDD